MAERSIYDLKTLIRPIDPFREDIVETVSASVTARRNAVFLGGAPPISYEALRPAPATPDEDISCESLEVDIDVLDIEGILDDTPIEERDTLASIRSTSARGGTTADQKPKWREQ